MLLYIALVVGYVGLQAWLQPVIKRPHPVTSTRHAMSAHPVVFSSQSTPECDEAAFQPI